MAFKNLCITGVILSVSLWYTVTVVHAVCVIHPVISVSFPYDIRSIVKLPNLLHYLVLVSRFHFFK